MNKKDILKEIESNLSDRKFIKLLKQYAVEQQSYEFAVQVRKYEKDTIGIDEEEAKLHTIVPEPEILVRLNELHEEVVSAQQGLDYLSRSLKERQKTFWNFIFEVYPQAKGYNWTYNKEESKLTRLYKYNS